MPTALADRRLQVIRRALVDGTAGQKARARWLATARPEQIPPATDWDVWLYLAGRGAGKTRSAAEWLANEARHQPGTRWAVVAATYADARDTCVEGESGLLAALGDDVRTWNRSLGELALHNGSRVKLFSADEPERLRGPQHHGAWCDELASWRYPEAWDQLLFGLRLGDRPRIAVTTTPRPTKLIRELIDRAQRGDGVVLRRGSTFDNEAHLAPSALAQLRERYEGTRLGRQELFAELLLDTPGALWTLDQLDECRVRRAPELVRSVVAVDPAVTSGEHSDETGIIAAGIGTDGDVYVLADRSGRFTPDEWGRRVVGLYDEIEGDRVVPEVNNGGDLVTSLLRTIDPAVPVKPVHATRGKRLRAEPVAALYEQGRVHHVGVPAELEEQMCGWTPEAGKSPDRLDALVWAITDLALAKQGRRTLRYREAA